MKKFFGSFPVNLVTYPLMIPMGIFWFIGTVALEVVKLPFWVLVNLGAILAAPFKGVATVARWTGDNIGYVLAFPFGPVTVLRTVGGDKKDSGTTMAVFIVATGVYFVAAELAFLFSLPSTDQSILWFREHRLIVGAFAAPLAFSSLYEMGRLSWLSFFGGETPAVPDAKVIAPQSHLTMFSKIQEKEKVSEEEAWTLLKEAAEVGANGKMKLGDMESIAKMISARAPTPAVVH